MPSKRLFFIAFWATFLVLGGSALMGAALRYFEMQELVDAAVFESSQRRRVIINLHRPIDRATLAAELRSGILERAGRSGVVLEDHRLVVESSEEGVSIAVNWTQPALALAGQSILSFPMSMERTFEVRTIGAVR